MNAGRTQSGQLLDLIYPENRSERVKEIRDVFQSRGVVLPSKLHRVTLFLTFRCNLRCSYCNTILPDKSKPWPAKGKDYDFKKFRDVIDELAPYRVQHLHLTGGEATLVKDLPRMVRYASECGIPCSLTTNGTADAALYRELVEKGLREIRISCDTHIPEDFEHTVGRMGAYQKVIKNIKELVGLRDEKRKNIYIIINMCVGQENRKRIAGFIENSIALKPDDVKLIGISHERIDLAAFDHRHQIIEEVTRYLSSFPENRFPLLRMKLKTIFAQDTYGLRDFTSRRLMKNCFVPLTERIFDSEYYYPCPVFVREGGKSLGGLDEDDFETQQQKTMSFVKSDSCMDDPICQEYCINCCKRFNLYANAIINRRVNREGGSPEPIAFFTEYTGEVTNREILASMREIQEERCTFSGDIPFQPFLAIKPSGMPYRGEIMSHLDAEGVAVARKVEIPDWNQVALRLYSVPLTEARVFRGLILAKSLPRVESTVGGELWILQGQHTFAELDNLKKRIRAKLPPSKCLIFLQDDLILTSLSYLHSPSESNYLIEANLLLNR